MKRIGNLFDEFYSFSNLLLAFKKARRGCRKNQETARFGFYLEKELLILNEELRSLSYQPGSFRYFMVNDPKKRTIAVAPFRDRVVHHALINLLEPIYEPCFIYDSYATRKNKGTHAAIMRARQFLSKNRWFLKMDIEKYFDNIDHNILKSLLERKIKDKAFLSILYKIIDNGGLYGKGLPIGNLTSQFLANVYLNALDHFIKENLRIRQYIRYMDDFVVFADDKLFIKSLRSTIEDFLGTHLQLKLKVKSTVLNQAQHGLSFVGARIYPGLIRIHPKTLRRSKMKLKQRKYELDNASLKEENYVAALNSINAHLSFFSGNTFRNQIFQQVSV